MRNKPMCRRIKLRPVFDRPGKWKEDTAMPSEHRRIFHRGALMHLAFLVYQKESDGVERAALNGPPNAFFKLKKKVFFVSR